MTVLPSLARKREYYKFFTPKGLKIKAQGKRSAALGENVSRISHPERVA
jgi:hypothetical protein